MPVTCQAGKFWTDWAERDKAFGKDRLAISPDYPDVVVRYHSADRETPDHLMERAQLGIKHFGRLNSEGLIVPPQRFFVAPGRYRLEPKLYSVTDLLHGRQLTQQLKDICQVPFLGC